jgi:hypothetical protein
MIDQAYASAGLEERLESVRRRIADCARRCGRSPEEITLVAISKSHPIEILRRAIDLGISNLGENRVQEAESKIEPLGRHAVRWHLVGHLQANKARKAVILFDIIHSLDSAALAQRLNRLCEEEKVDQLAVLIQVDLAGEKTKSGVAKAELPKVAAAVKQSNRLRLLGLMTLPPFFDNVEAVRPFFRELREARDELQGKGFFSDGPGQLSMGMTHDFEVAIEEGATMVRVGTAIFGERESVK